MECVDATTELGTILVWCSGQKATDLHIQADHRYSIRQDGKLRRIAPGQFAVPGNDDVMRMLHQAFTRLDLRSNREATRDGPKLSLRAGALSGELQQTARQAVLLVPGCAAAHAQTADLDLPATVADLVKEPRGLLIVTGASGQGKSTTVRGLLQRLNETLALRIITIEDPIEYLFEEDQCQFEHARSRRGYGFLR